MTKEGYPTTQVSEMACETLVQAKVVDSITRAGSTSPGSEERGKKYGEKRHVRASLRQPRTTVRLTHFHRILRRFLGVVNAHLAY